VCTSRKITESFQVKVDVQKGALKFKENLTIDVLVSCNSHHSPNESMTNMYVLVRICILVLGF
jgi:hypothetical protein